MNIAEKKRKFLQSYTKTLNISQSAKKIKVSDRTIRNWRQDDSDFRTAMTSIESQKAHNRTCSPKYPTPSPSHTSSERASIPSIAEIKQSLRGQLKAQGKVGAMIDSQLELTAIAWHKMLEKYYDTQVDGYSATMQTVSREGDARYSGSPTEDGLLKWWQACQKGLDASGLNFNSKAFDMREMEEMPENEKRNIEYRQTRLPSFEG